MFLGFGLGLGLYLKLTSVVERWLGNRVSYWTAVQAHPNLSQNKMKKKSFFGFQINDLLIKKN